MCINLKYNKPSKKYLQANSKLHCSTDSGGWQTLVVARLMKMCDMNTNIVGMTTTGSNVTNIL